MAWDAVELPSQFLENFAWRPEVLARIARHFETGAAAARGQASSTLQRSRTFLAGLAMVRQLEFALFDFRLHDEYDPERGARVHEILARGARARWPWCRSPACNRFPNTLRHIFGGGYAAGYYSYKWAEVLAADAFAAFEESGRVRPRHRRALPARHPRSRRQPQRARCVRRVPRPPAAARRPAAAVRHRDPCATAVKVATWNVNSIKVRLEHVLAWLDREQPDVLALQEIKTKDEDFPVDALSARGYSSIVSGQAGYNGVALVSRIAPSDVAHGIGGYVDEQKRVLGATRSPACASTACTCRTARTPSPTSTATSSSWLAALRNLLAVELTRYPHLAVAGDFNVAPDDRDVYDPAAWAGQVLCTPAERAALASITELGLRDSFRLFDQPPGKIQLVGLSCRHVSPQSRLEDRPRARVSGFKSNLHELSNRSGSARLGAAVGSRAGDRGIRSCMMVM